MSGKRLSSFHASVVKDINEQVVLKHILEHGIISSSELVKITGMRPSTIFNILKELSSRDLVCFNGKGDSTEKGGKKPYTWILNKDAAYVIGIDIEVGEMTAVVLDFCGGIIAKNTIQINIGRTVDELGKAIITVVEEIIVETKIDVDKILGLGVAFAGIVDYKTGVVIMSSVMPEMNFPLLDKLKDLPFPVFIENNANAAAIGLKWRDKDKTKKNFLSILVEIDKSVSGLGIGIVVNGRLYHGASFCAGELHTNLPTLKELLATIRSRFVESEIFCNYTSSLGAIDMKFLLDAAKKGDPIANRLFSMIGGVVGQTIAPAIGLLNPDTIVITGMVSEIEDVLIDSIRKAIEMRVLSFTTNALTITTDKKYHYSVSLGAAALVLEDYFRLPLLSK